MANLYQINEQILGCVDMETGEIVDMDKLQELQLEFDQKVEGIACWIKNLLSEARQNVPYTRTGLSANGTMR